MKSLSLIGPQREHRSNTHICIGKHRYFSFDLIIEIFCVCVLVLRGSWTTNQKTKTTLCLFLLFMEDRKYKDILGISITDSAFSPHLLHSFPLHISTKHHLIGPSTCAVTTEVIDVGAGISGNSEMEICGTCKTGILMTLLYTTFLFQTGQVQVAVT